MERCWDVGIAFQVEIGRVDAFLPDGFRAEPAPQTIVRLAHSNVVDTVAYPAFVAGADPMTALVLLISHACTMDMPHFGSMEEFWIVVGIEPPDHGDELGLRYAALELYDLGVAGGSPEVLERKAALGWNVFGDHVETSALTRSESLGSYSGYGRVHQNGVEVLSIDVRDALWSPSHSSQTIRFWNRGPEGVAVTDAVLSATGLDSYFSFDFDCTMAPGSLAAQITGYTSCAEAIADSSRPSPIAIINPYHEHGLWFQYAPFE